VELLVIAILLGVAELLVIAVLLGIIAWNIRAGFERIEKKLNDLLKELKTSGN